MRILFDLFFRFWSSRELANGGLLVVAGDVVPLDVVVVEVVEHGQAALVALAVVRLRSVVSDQSLIIIYYNHHYWIIIAMGLSSVVSGHDHYWSIMSCL